MTKNEKNTTHKTRPHTKLISHGFFNGRREVFSVVSQTSMVFPRRTFNKMRLLSRVPITNQKKKYVKDRQSCPKHSRVCGRIC